METKLTLKLDQSVIQSVKIYAEKNNRSLSKLVEDYFRNLIIDSDNAKSKISPLVQELSGIISERDLTGINYIDYLESKYE
jgi:hypothetical protein